MATDASSAQGNTLNDIMRTAMIKAKIFFTGANVNGAVVKHKLMFVARLQEVIE